MNAATTLLRTRLEALSAALARGDDRAARRGLFALARLAEGHWCATLAAAVRQLHEELDRLPGEAQAPADGLPDARARLEHVARLTEQAANRTLDCIESGQRVAEELGGHPDPVVRGAAATLRAALRDAAAAQAYQDVTTQILRQVTAIVVRLGGSLDALVADAAQAGGIAAPGRVALPGQPDAASQRDADTVLEAFGL